MPLLHLRRPGRVATVCCASVLASALTVTGMSTAVAGTVPNPAPDGFSTPSSLPQAHAHNDYLHTHPLWDALGQGFTSIEADIWFEDGQLLLGHTRQEATDGPAAGRSLEDWYLRPLAEWVRGNGGQVFDDRTEPVRLLVDVKDGGVDTLNRTEEILASYEDVLTSVRDGVVQPGAIEVVYSGEPPFGAIADRAVRYGFYDGRPTDLQGPGGFTAQDMPLVSSGVEGVLPDLRGFTGDVAAAGSQSRVWGVPETNGVADRAAWAAQLDAGLDVIGTDDLVGLREFLVSRPG